MKEVLAPLHLDIEIKSGELQISKGKSAIRIHIIRNEHTNAPAKGSLSLPIDYLVKQPEKIAAIIQSKLGLNQRIFARHCESKKVNKGEAEQFLQTYHLMNSTQSASNYGLYYKGELMAVASFSKGRKMRRLTEDQRSFELIRFCCKSGYTITGGLSKLLGSFVKEKNPGDVMTYVDAQWSDGQAFTKAGFVRMETTPPRTFIINKTNFERKEWKDENIKFDTENFFLLRDSGNLKMIYTPLATK